MSNPPAFEPTGRQPSLRYRMRGRSEMFLLAFAASTGLGIYLFRLDVLWTQLLTVLAGLSLVLFTASLVVSPRSSEFADPLHSSPRDSTK